ncbi:hypothetical protein ACWEKT_27885 [Nocardia takedensis]|nr:hypothetical protein [Nocardia takedensis]
MYSVSLTVRVVTGFHFPGSIPRHAPVLGSGRSVTAARPMRVRRP